MKLTLALFFLCGMIIGWGLTTIHMNERAREEIEIGVNRALKQGMLVDKDGNVYIITNKK
jgi:hypothetical protein